jgi:hypothetical protein
MISYPPNGIDFFGVIRNVYVYPVLHVSNDDGVTVTSPSSVGVGVNTVSND